MARSKLMAAAVAMLLITQLVGAATSSHPTESPTLQPTLPPTQVYIDFPATYASRIGSSHPRIFLPRNLATYRALYNDPNPNEATQYLTSIVQGLMECASSADAATCDWRWEIGWPAAVLALVYQITGNGSYAQQACNVFVPPFEGVWLDVGGDVLTSLHWALAYDWLYGHSCMDQIVPGKGKTVQQFLADGLIGVSNTSCYMDDNLQSDIYHDSDRNIHTVAGHFFAGVVLQGESSMAPTLLSRGWTGWYVGLSTYYRQEPAPYNNLMTFPAVNFFKVASGSPTTVGSGVPLTGWDYGPGSDLSEGVYLYELMDDLGIIDDEHPEIKPFWKDGLSSFMRDVDPANALFKWLGDVQDPTDLDTFVGYLNSYITNCIYFADRMGYTTEAAWGRYFWTHMTQPSYYPEGYQDAWFMHSWNASAAMVDYSTTMPLNDVSSVGADQRAGFGTFRTAWNGPSSASATAQVTWGSVCAMGNYVVDHITNCAGSLHLWRNGDFLVTDPRGYGANTIGEIFNSLSILNPYYDPTVRPGADPTDIDYLVKGPLVYDDTVGTPYMEAGRQHDDVFYALVNLDNGYNMIATPYDDSCSGICMQPVANYSRHIAYDMGDIVVIVDRAVLQYQTDVALRFRNNGLNATTLPTSLSNALLKMPSDKGNYRTLIKILTTPPPTPWAITDEHTIYADGDYRIQTDQIGALARTKFPRAWSYNIVTALHVGKTALADTTLDSATVISSADSFGGCAVSLCVIVGLANGYKRASTTYTTPAGMSTGAKHIVTDLAPGCYAVNGGGVAVGGLVAVDNDFTIAFAASDGAAHTYAVTTDLVCTTAPSMQPTSHAPTSKPASQSPTTFVATTKAPTTHAPASTATTAKPTTTQKPTTHKPTTHKPTTRKPTTQKPTTHKPTTHKPTTSAG